MKKRILIAEDSNLSRKILKTILSFNKFEVIETADGEQAKSSIIENKPDLILLDVNMPKMDGFEVALEIKKNPETKDIPILFISAASDNESIIKGFKSGAVDYVGKPFNEEELMARINTHLMLKQLNLELVKKVDEIQLKNKEITKQKEEIELRNKKLNKTMGELKDAYSKLEETQDELIKTEQKNTALAMAVTANHEINQPLMVIKGNLDLLECKLDENSDLKKYIEKIDNSIKRINKILNNMKGLEQHKNVNFQTYTTDVNMIDITDKDTDGKK